MDLQSQLTSLELSKKLRELGVKQESLFWWHESRTNRSEKTGFESLKTGKFYLHQSKGDYSAFTVAELGEMLLVGCSSFKNSDGTYWCIYQPRHDPGEQFTIHSRPTEADARAKMLIYLLENKLITV